MLLLQIKYLYMQRTYTQSATYAQTQKSFTKGPNSGWLADDLTHREKDPSDNEETMSDTDYTMSDDGSPVIVRKEKVFSRGPPW